MILRSFLLLSLSLTCAAVSLPAQAFATEQSQGFQLSASYDRPGLPVPRWKIHIGASGTAEYTSERATPLSGTSDEPVTFTFSHAGTAKLRKLLDDSHNMQPCETKTKGLARMGMKTLQYQGGATPAARCTFNFTDNKPLAAAADYLLAVSFTIEQGASLEHLHRYDRLGLDPVMTQLATAVKDGRAQELQAIRPTLVSLAADDAVLERVRQKATALLAQIEQP